ncbi:sensor domain-containing diguanylate cyclase [Gilvimarinus agarilyticus]|uniref:sensor domain-containing diguanylate cyclase n=1 Tax=Gilvimarinus agarilyticus TaxID=679259 RepID=UPI00059FCC87|nr:sensor domain-containing diguanylate cyclase [Gilvimarinus agarilyticus]
MSDTPEDAAFYKTLLESTHAIPWKIDWETMTFAYIGPQIEKLLGWSTDSWISANDWAERMHPEDRDWVVNFCISQSKEGVDHEADYRALCADGSYLWIRDVVHVVRNDEGAVESLVGFMFDISERKKIEDKLVTLQQELEELSFKDGLTGVANRRMLDSVLDKEWSDARRNSQPLSVIIFDIDYFKQYNDHFGHIQGDDCLRLVAKTLSQGATRHRDFFARYGGEEFMLILPDTDKAAAAKVAERCRELIFKQQLPHPSSATGPVVTVSQGVGTITPKPTDSPKTFIQSVDKSLYQAKQSGRNKIMTG